jgi:hypothetical protein
LKRTVALLLVVALAAACSANSDRLRDKALQPYAIGFRLGDSTRVALRGRLNLHTVGDGIYWWETTGPGNVRRRVSVRTDGDAVHWFQVQDTPVAPHVADEERRFADEVLRLSALLGVGDAEVGRGGAVNQATWRLPDGTVLLLQLEITTDAQSAVRSLGVGLAKYNLLPLLKEQSKPSSLI